MLLRVFLLTIILIGAQVAFLDAACPGFAPFLPLQEILVNSLVQPNWRETVDFHENYIADDWAEGGNGPVVYDPVTRGFYFSRGLVFAFRAHSGVEYVFPAAPWGLAGVQAITVASDGGLVYLYAAHRLYSIEAKFPFDTASTVVAGDGTSGHEFDTAPYRFGQIRALWRIGETLLMLDEVNHCIISLGIEAGSAPVEYAGACGTEGVLDGTLTVARFSSPVAMAFQNNDAAGLGFVAHSQRRIRKITLTSVSTVVNDPTLSTFLAGITVHPHFEDTLWVSMTSNRILFLHNSTSGPTDYSLFDMDGGLHGSWFCAASMGLIRGMTVDRLSGDMVWSDATNSRLWRIRGLLSHPNVPRFRSFNNIDNFLSWTVSHVASGSSISLPHQGVHSAVTGDYFFIRSGNVHRIAYGSSSLTFLGNGAGHGMTINALGTRVFTTGPAKILAFDVATPGTVFDAAGTGTAGHSSGPALASQIGEQRFLFRVNTKIYFGDRSRHCIRWYDYAAETVGDYACICQTPTPAIRDGTFEDCHAPQPYGIAFQTTFSTRIGYFSQSSQNFRKMDGFYRTVTTILKTGITLSNGVMPHPLFDNVLYHGCYSGCAGGMMGLWNGFTANRTTAYSWAQPAVAGPLSIAAGTQVNDVSVNWDSGSFFLTDRTNNLIGSVQGLWGTLEWDATKDYNDGWGTFGSWWMSTPTSVSGLLRHPEQIVYNLNDKFIYFTVSGVDRVYRWNQYSPSSNLPAWSAAIGAPVLGITVEATGNILVAVPGRLNRIMRLDPSDIFPIAGTGTVGFGTGSPASTMIGHWRSLYRVGLNVFATDTHNHCIVRFSASQIQQYACRCTVAGVEDGTLDACTATEPKGIAFMNHSSSAIGYFVHGIAGQALVRRISEFWGSVTTVFAGASGSVFAGLVVHPHDEHLVWVSDLGSGDRGLHMVRRGKVMSFVSSGGFSRSQGTVTSYVTALHSASGMTINDDTGEMWIAGGTQQMVHKICCLWNVSHTVTVSASITPTASGSTTASPSDSESATGSPSPTDSTSATASPSITPSTTGSTTASPSDSESATGSPSPTDSTSATLSPTRSASSSISPSPTPGATATHSSTRSSSVSVSGSSSGTRSVSSPPTASTSGSSSATRSASPSVATPSTTQTMQPTVSISHSSTLTSAPTSTRSGTSTKSPVTGTASRERTSSHTYYLPPQTPAPPLAPGEPCQQPPSQRPSSRVAVTHTVEEVQLRQRRLRFNISLSQALAAAGVYHGVPASVFPRPLDPQSFGTRHVTQPQQAPSDLGLAAHLDGRGDIRNVSVTLISHDVVDVDIGPFASYDISSAAETMDVYLGVQWFLNATRLCGTPSASERHFMRIGALVVNPSPVAFLEDVAVVADAIGTTVIAAAAAGGGSPADVQTLALMGMMSCARPDQQAMSGSQRGLSPMMLDNTLEGMLGGNLILFLLIVVVHGGAAAIWTTLRRRGKSEEERAQHPSEPMAMLRFPSLTIAAIGVLHQGTAFFAVRLLFGSSSSPGARVLGAVGLLYAITVPLLVVVMSGRLVDAAFIKYEFDSVPGDGSPHVAVPRLWRALLPWGRWEPRVVRLAYGSMFASLAKSDVWWSVFPFVSPSMIAISASAMPSERVGCAAQFGCIAAIQFMYLVFQLVTRPYRSVVANTLAVTSSLTLVIIASNAAVGISRPHLQPQLSVITGATILAQMIISMLRLSFTVWCSAVEVRLTTGVVTRVVMRRRPRRDFWRSDSGARELDEIDKCLVSENETPMLQPVEMRNVGPLGRSLSDGEPSIDSFALRDTSIGAYVAAAGDPFGADAVTFSSPASPPPPPPASPPLSGVPGGRAIVEHSAFDLDISDDPFDTVATHRNLRPRVAFDDLVDLLTIRAEPDDMTEPPRPLQEHRNIGRTSGADGEKSEEALRYDLL